MAPPLSRRTLLQTAILATAGPGLAATASTVTAWAATLPAPAAWRLRPFHLEDVTLGSGVFADKRRLMLDHARGYDVNRLLQVFRANAGLPSDGTEFAPFFEGTEDPTHAYVRRAEPRVVFGGTDSGVANPARPDGTTLLDEIWAGAPFASKGALVARVWTTVDAWVAAGLLGRADGDRIGATAARASYVS